MKFGDLGEIFDGPHATPKRVTEGPYFLNISSLAQGRLDLSRSDHIDPKQFIQWTKRVTPQAGDLLFSYETRLGEAALMPKGISACLGRRMALLRPDKEVVEPKFLLYWYLGPQMQKLIEKHSVMGATVPRILLSDMPTWPVNLPPLAEQMAIAEALGALDEKIAVNGKLAMTCETLMRQSVTAMALDAQLSDLVTAVKEQVPVSVMATMTVDHYSLPAFDQTQLPLQEAGAGIRSNKFRLAGAAVLLSKLNPRFPRVWNVPRPGENAVASTEFLVLKPFNLPSAAVWALLATSRTTAYLVEHAAGTSGSHQRVRPEDALRIPMPSRAQLSGRMLDQLVGLGDRALLAREESQKLAQLRDTLLPALMDGRLRVRDAIAQAEDLL